MAQSIAAFLFALNINKEKIVLQNPLSFFSKEFIYHMLFVYFGNLLQFFAYRMDVWILDYFHSKREVGIYSFSVRIAQLFWVIPQLMALLLFPLTALKHDSVSEKKFNRMILLSVIITLTGSVFSIFVYPPMVNFIMGNEYNESYTYFIYLLPGIIFFSINILLAARMAGKGNVYINLQAAAICFLIVLILDFLLIPGMKGKGAAIATSIGYSISSIFVFIKYMKWIKN